MATIRLTMAQALVRYLTVQKTIIDGEKLPIFAGVFAIFGHGNVAGMGEALYQVRDTLPTYRGQNEQSMAHAATAYAKAMRRRRFMACTTSIGPGATNMVTAAAVAHVNRVPLLLLPGDVFANRRPDPVLQQLEDFGDGTLTPNDTFRAVSRYFDRITRPEQIIPALARAMAVLTDPAECGPVTLALCQDVQAEAYDYPASMFEERVWTQRRPHPDEDELSAAVTALKAAKKPVIVSGGGTLFSQAEKTLASFALRHGIPIGETQGGKSVVAHDFELGMGAVGVTGTGAANAVSEEADLVLAVGTRLQDFTTGSWALFKGEHHRIIGLNTQPFDATKHSALPLVCDARVGLERLTAALGDWTAPADWTRKAKDGKAEWQKTAARYTGPSNAELPSDANVIGAVQRMGQPSDVVVCASGGLPGELHKLWNAGAVGGYHMEYGFSCMGYEIAGGLGVKMADPSREVIVMLGDGSYMMANSEIYSSIMIGMKLIIVVLDNRGFGCINRLQRACGGESFNNLLRDTRHGVLPDIDFAAHAASMGALAVKVAGIGEFEDAMKAARGHTRTTVIVVDTDPLETTDAGGHWWDVAVPEVSVRPQVEAARENYIKARQLQRLVN